MKSSRPLFLFYSLFPAVCLFPYSQAQAACSSPTPVTTPGSTVVCSGTTSNQLMDVLASHVTVMNNGVFEYTNPIAIGSSTPPGGVVGSSLSWISNLQNVRIENNGTMDFPNVIVSPFLVGTFGALSFSYFTGSSNSNQSFKNHPGATLKAEQKGGTGDLAGVALFSGSGGNNSVENEGTIEVKNDFNGKGVLGISVYHGASTSALYETKNSGTVRAISSTIDNSYDPVTGIAHFWMFSGATSRIINSGSVEIHATNPGVSGDGVGIDTYLNQINSSIDNSGTITLTGNFSTASAGIRIGDMNTTSVITTITNSGTITVPPLSGARSILGNSAREFVTNSGTLNGNLDLGLGSDSLTIKPGSVINGTINGGDNVSSADGMVDVLTFDGFVGTSPKALNWEQIVLINSADVTLAHDTTAETWTVNSGTTLVSAPVGAVVTRNISGAMTNKGTLSLNAATAGDALNVTGDYTSTNGALSLGVTLNDGGAATVSDQLHIVGNVTGTTTLQISNVGGLGALTTGNGILLVSVTGNSPAGAFVLPVPLDVGGYRYELKQIGKNWYLQSVPVPSAVSESLVVNAGTAGSINVLANDLLGNSAAAIPNVTLTVVGSLPAGITLDTSTGLLTVPSTTPAGVYAVTYQLCNAAAPTLCSTATSTITVNDIIQVFDDETSGSAGTGASVNIWGNDTINGSPVNGSNSVFSLLSTVPAGASFDSTTGIFSVPPHSLPGTYKLDYQICSLSTSVCKKGTARLLIAADIPSLSLPAQLVLALGLFVLVGLGKRRI